MKRLKLKKEQPLEKKKLNVEIDAREELTDIQKQFKEAAKNERQIFIDNTDSEYFVCLGFQNREQKEEFLKTSGLIKIGDKYLNGIEAAEILGIQLQSRVYKDPKFNINKKWQNLT
jgi:hypothetical protein